MISLLGRPRGPERLRGRRSRAAARSAATPTPPQRRNDAYRAFFEQMPTFSPDRDAAAVPQGRASAAPSTCSCSTSASTAQPALRRQGGASVRRARPATHHAGRRRSCAFLDERLTKSKATWKVIANEVIMSRRSSSMRPAFADYDAWARATRSNARRSCARSRTTDDVVFVTGDYPHVHRSSTSSAADGTTVAPEFVRRSRSPRSATREISGDAGDARLRHARTTRPSLRPQLQAIVAANPWFVDYRPDPPRLRRSRGIAATSSGVPTERWRPARQVSGPHRPPRNVYRAARSSAQKL